MRIPRPLSRAVARAKPMVPGRMWPLLLALRSLAGDGPVVGLPAWPRVLALAAHPDDETMGCGGTLALLADAGAEVTVAFATDGEATRGSGHDAAVTAGLRREEARAACRVLGAGPARFLGHPDGGLAERVEELAPAVAGVVADTDPGVVFLPWFLDGHPDHRALSTALGLVPPPLVTPPGQLEVWAYETWTPLPANRLVDISAVLDRKRRALAAHATAHLAFDVDASLGLSRWRSIHGLMGRGHAEAFLAAPVSDYLALMRSVEAAPAPARSGTA